MIKRVLIIGSSGMLGIDLCCELRGRYEVYGADIIGSRGKGQGARKSVKKNYPCDITNKKSISDVVARVNPDIAIHAAAWTDVDGCEKDPGKAYRINRDGTRNVALACKKNKALLVYLSTDFVFNGRKKTPYRESDKPSPLGVYADSKLAGELAVKDVLKNYLIIRTSWLYGKFGKNFVDTIIAKARTEPVLKVVNDQVGSPTYTKDLARALHALLDRIFTKNEKRKTNDARGIYHVSNAGSVSWYEYAKTILRMVGLKTEVAPISSEELARPAKRPAMSVLNCSKFTKLTGFKMRSWKSALREYLSK